MSVESRTYNPLVGFYDEKDLQRSGLQPGLVHEREVDFDVYLVGTSVVKDLKH